MKTSKKNFDEQTVVEKGNNARIEVNINTNGNNEPKKKSGSKFGAVVGTLGGVLLGGAAAAYAIENEITMEDIEEGVNDFIEDVERGYNAAVNGDKATSNEEQPAEPKEGAEVDSNEPTVTPEPEAPAEPEIPTHEDIINKIDSAVNGGETPAEPENPTHEDIINHINNAVNDGEQSGETLDDGQLDVSDTNFDDMSFDEAFAAARAEAGGPGGVFEWRGGLYGTFSADEWSELSDDDKAEYGSKVTDILAEYEFGHEEETNVEVTPENNTGAEFEVTPEDNPGADVEVEVVNTWEITDASGDQMNVAHMSVDGHEVALIDQDGDGVYETMAYDENQDGTIDETDMFNIEDQGFTTDEIGGLMDDTVADDGADFMA
jgi:hypothetical protein